jgi:hypothetical protein
VEEYDPGKAKYSLHKKQIWYSKNIRQKKLQNKYQESTQKSSNANEKAEELKE